MRGLLLLITIFLSSGANAQQRVVMVGDSLSSTTFVAGEYFGWHFITTVLGIGSTTSGDGAGNGDGESVATKITNGKIIAGDIVTLMYGTNDYRAEDGIPDTGINDAVAVSVANMLSMAAEVAAVPAIPVIIAAPPCVLNTGQCSQAGYTYNRAPYLEAMASALAAAVSATDYAFVNAWDAFDAESQSLGSFFTDSVHPNASGRLLLWGDVVGPKLLELFPAPSDATRP